MARMVTRQRTVISTVAAWLAGFVIFFPILWMVLASFKTELEAFATPPSFLFFHWTTENYVTVQERSDYFHHALNSIIIAGGSTLLAMLIAIPAAWSMAFAPTKRTKDILLWMLSTKMMPAVGVLMPIYLICQRLELLDTTFALGILYALMNLPIVMIILFNYFREIPKEILEASRMDGTSTYNEIVLILIPLAWGGIASTALLSIVLLWNEAFWSINLTSSNAGTLVALVASFSNPEGLFWAKVSAVSTLACAPIMVLGWLTQKQLVRGLTFGAVK
jgi:sorbitol/mannitol transport system permease protein